MQQRVGLAQALINNPDLLILDEPTSGLDPLGRMKVREIIQRLKNEGKTVFFSSHELGEVETVCDRVAIINQGELKVEGRVADLVEQHQANLEQIFLNIIGYQPRTRRMNTVFALAGRRHQGTVPAQGFLCPVRPHRAHHAGLGSVNFFNDDQDRALSEGHLPAADLDFRAGDRHRHHRAPDPGRAREPHDLSVAGQAGDARAGDAGQVRSAAGWPAAWRWLCFTCSSWWSAARASITGRCCITCRLLAAMVMLGMVVALVLLGSVVFAAPSSNATISFIVVLGILFLGRHLNGRPPAARTAALPGLWALFSDPAPGMV